MKTRMPLAALVGALLAAAAYAQTAVTDETVVAKVGNTGVTRGQWRTQLLKYYGQNGLEQLVNRSAMRQEAARLKAEVTEAAIAQRLAEFKRRAGAEFQTALDAQGITEAVVKDRIRADLLAEATLDKKWPVRDSDLVRISMRYARLQSERVARDLIQEASLSKGRNFELLVLQRSLDRENAGLVQPDPFLRIENPPMFRLAADAIRSQGLAVGQMTRKPIQSQEFWLVIKLEKYLGPETLKGEERERVVQRIRAARLPALLPAVRKRFKVEKPVAAAQLVADLKIAPDTPLVEVTPIGSDKGETITYRDLNRYLVENFGRLALDQVVERAMITQQAAKVGASVSDAEVENRFSTVKKGTGEKAFQDALNLEGITEDAWKERVRYTYLAEKTVNARAPLTQNDLVRLTARYIRVGTREEAAEMVKLAQSAGPQFEALAKQRSLDRNGDHFVRPRFFLQAEQPEIFKALTGGVPGQVLAKPLELNGSYYVLKLEGRFGPETLTGKERDDAIRRINALRMGPLLDVWRKEIKVEYPVPMKTLVGSAGA